VEKRAVKTPFGSHPTSMSAGRSGQTGLVLPGTAGAPPVAIGDQPRANIFGFKLLGAERIVSISAVGSLKEDLRPRDIVLPDQYFDRTKAGDAHTFFGNGVVAHISFASPRARNSAK